MPRSIELSELERRKMAEAGRQSIACTNGWRPIETAPKDGREILAWNHGVICICRLDEDGHWVRADGLIAMKITHWQPLPAPPDIIGEQIIREEEEAEIRRELDFEDEFPHGLEGDE